MSFNFLEKRLNKSIKDVQKRAILTEENILEILKEIRIVLLDADVNIKVADEFIENVKTKSIGKVVDFENTSSQEVLKIINSELIRILGGEVKE